MLARQTFKTLTLLLTLLIIPIAQAYAEDLFYTFEDETAYQHDSGLSLTSGTVQLTVVDTTDDDLSDTGFLSENLIDCSWNETELWAEIADPLSQDSCDYLSRLFDAGNTVSWNRTLSWTPSHPTQNALIMEGNTLLMHLNENGGEAFEDLSSSALLGTCANCPETGIAGRFNTAPNFHADNEEWIHLGTTNLVRNAKRAMASVWIKPASLEGEQNVLAISEKTKKNKPNASRFQIRLYDSKIELGGRAGDGEPIQRPLANTTLLTAGEWYHVVGIINYEDDSMQVYINGVAQELSEKIKFNAEATSDTESTNSSIGAEDDGDGAFFDGQIDEIALWEEKADCTSNCGRIPTEEEILALYERGARRLRLQVRTCESEESCETNPFIGPNGTSTTYYDEQLNSGSENPSIDLQGLEAQRYFQYKATLETENATSPALQSVSLSPAPYYAGVSILTSLNTQEYDTLEGFDHTTGDNHTGLVTYQISNDGGLTWYFYNGTDWQEAGSSVLESNFVEDLDAHIVEFGPSAEQNFAFRAFFNSNNGSDAIELIAVHLSYTRIVEGEVATGEDGIHSDDTQAIPNIQDGGTHGSDLAKEPQAQNPQAKVEAPYSFSGSGGCGLIR